MVVKADSRAYSQKVKTGIQQGAMIQIVSGLQPGEQVIVSGQYGLAGQDKSEGHARQRQPWQEGRGVEGHGGYSFERA